MEELSLDHKKIYLLRHSDAEDLGLAKNDFERNLSPVGKEKVRAFSQKHASFINTDFILCSSANRTRQTLDLLGLVGIDTAYIDDLYMADLKTISQVIQNIDDRYKNVLVVGHNNGISDFVSHLTGAYTSLSTCEMVEIELQISSWKQIAQEIGITRRKFL